MSSFKLQQYIRKFSDTELVAYTDVDNYQLNGRWVTDINRNYYEEIAADILEILQENSTKGEVSEFKTSLLEAKQKTLKKWREVTIGSNEIHTIIKHSSPVQPINSTLDFLDDEEQEERKSVVFDTVIELLNSDLGKFSQNDLHSYLLSPEANKSDRDIKFDYAYGHLYYVLLIRVETIDGLLKELEKLDNSVNLNPMQNTSGNPFSIQFKLIKKDVTILFHTLHELNILTANDNNWNNSQEKLKAWLNNSNIYYTNKTGQKAIVKNINRYFSDLNTKYWDDDEIKFLEKTLIPKLRNRLKELKDRQGKK